MKRKHNEVDNMAYKFAAYPTEEQRTLFAKTVGCVRFVYNHMLADKKSHYEATKENINPTPAQYKKEFEFLKEVDSLALANSQMALNKAFLSFYKGNTKFPKYKAKHRGRRAYTTKLFVSSDGQIGNYPRYYRAMEEKLAREQRKLSKMVQGSNNYYRQKRKIGKLHAKIKHQRRDFLHQTSRTLVDNYDVICIEDLDMKAMAQALNFGKSVCDNGWGIFRSQLVYKLAAENKNLVIIDKWFPSSKTCIECGYVHHSLTLSDRIYICPVCGNIIDRDYQAANNIKNEGFRILLEALLKDLEPQELAGIAC